MRPRLPVPTLKPGLLTLDAAAAHHLTRVLRAQVADPLTLFDGQGREAQATITLISKDSVTVQVEDIDFVNRESPLAITVVQALCTGDKMDWVVQKSTELGATRIIPVAAARSVLRLEGTRAEKRVSHWQAIAQAAAAQCGRTRIPEVTPVSSLAEAIANWVSQPSPKTGWLLDPFALERLTQAKLSGAITILIGPEAGWSDEEESAAKAAGLIGIQAGPRILRTETAAAVVLTAIAVRAGEF